MNGVLRLVIAFWTAFLTVEALSSNARCQDVFNIDTNAHTAIPGGLVTPFGIVHVTGFSDDLPDPDLGSGRVFSNVLPTTPNSAAKGTAEIRLQGALATSISFSYGIRGDQNSGEVGGFTAYGFSESALKVNPKGPGAVFKQFAVNTGQPTGPVTIKGLPQDQATNPTGTKYFNGLRWTTSTKANDVLSISRTGKSQLKAISITYEKASDIYQNKGSFTDPTLDKASITVAFDAKGKSGVVILEDLAKAIDPKFNHFNWVQTMELKTSNATIERLKLIANAPSMTSGSFVDPHIDPHPNPLEKLAYVKNKGTQQEEGYLIEVEEVQDKLDFYLNEGGANPEWTKYVTPTSLLFQDAPSMPVAFYQNGDTMFFRTELYAVSPDGTHSRALGVGFTYKSNSRWKRDDQGDLVHVDGQVSDVKFFGLQ